MIRTTAALVLAAIVIISAGSASTAADRCAQHPDSLAKFELAKEPKAAPEATFIDENDQEKTLADYRGNGLIVNFWATWCAPCVKEMPALDRLAKELKGERVVLLTLSADREGAPLVRKFYDKNGIANLPVAIDRTSKVARALGVDGLPTTILFDADGQEVGRVVGVAEWDAGSALIFLRGCLAPAA